MDRFEEMQTFVGVVDAGSFSAAAERLRLAKSAVSRRVAELEARLGTQLLNRTTRRLSLTDSGRQFYDRATRVLADLEEAEQTVSRGQSELRGRLRVAAPLSFGILHLAPLLTAFLGEHPELSLDLDLNDRNVNLVEEGFDLAVRIGELSDSTLVARRLAPTRMVLCASPAYLERHGEPRSPEELAKHQGLIYANLPDPRNWPYTDPAGRPLNLRVPVRMRSNNGDVLLRAALDGLGLGVMPSFIVWRELADGRLRTLLPDHPLPVTAAYAVFPSRRHVPHRVRALSDFLAERLGDEPYWDLPPAAGANEIPV